MFAYSLVPVILVFQVMYLSNFWRLRAARWCTPSSLVSVPSLRQTVSPLSARWTLGSDAGCYFKPQNQKLCQEEPNLGWEWPRAGYRFALNIWTQLSAILAVSSFICIWCSYSLDLWQATEFHLIMSKPSPTFCVANKTNTRQRSNCELSHKQLLLSAPSFIRQYARNRNIRSESEEKAMMLLAYWCLWSPGQHISLLEVFTQLLDCSHRHSYGEKT